MFNLRFMLLLYRPQSEKPLSQREEKGVKHRSSLHCPFLEGVCGYVALYNGKSSLFALFRFLLPFTSNFSVPFCFPSCVSLRFASFTCSLRCEKSEREKISLHSEKISLPFHFEPKSNGALYQDLFTNPSIH
jgi:hypothetical protein